MPHVTFIYPCVGRFGEANYVRSWQMQPLAIATLSALTPCRWERCFFDDRLERIDYDQATDLAAISIETFTARRGYQIAAEYRRRGVPVIMGGYHATFCPDEVSEHADSVCIGEAESVWAEILDDAERGELRSRYQRTTAFSRDSVIPDRTIFGKKNYFRIALVETGRGCRFGCSFCSISAFHKQRCAFRPVSSVMQEVLNLREKSLFLVDDNIVGDLGRARELFSALKGSGVKWVGQASMNVAHDCELMDIMAESGCVGLLVGFESLESRGLELMNKRVNQKVDYSSVMAEFRKRGIVIYGTFLLGLPSDSEETADSMVAFAQAEKIYIAAFNHIVPFPGTPLYDELYSAGRMLHNRWWMSEDYRFGDVPFLPESATEEQLRDWCHRARVQFYSFKSILTRALDFSANLGSFRKSFLYFALNALLRREIRQKRGLPLGQRDSEWR